MIFQAIDWNLWKNFLTPLNGNISEQCSKDSELYINTLNSVRIQFFFFGIVVILLIRINKIDLGSENKKILLLKYPAFMVYRQ